MVELPLKDQESQSKSKCRINSFSVHIKTVIQGKKIEKPSLRKRGSPLLMLYKCVNNQCGQWGLCDADYRDLKQWRGRRQTKSVRVYWTCVTPRTLNRNYNAHAQPLFCSVNLLHGGVLRSLLKLPYIRDHNPTLTPKYPLTQIFINR